MKLHSTFLVFFTLFSICAPAVGAEFSINFKADKEVVAKISLVISNDIATTSVEGITEKFNLKEMSWLEEKSGQWVTLQQCEEWARQSKARSAKSADSAPEHVRAFLLWSIEPTFKVEKLDGTLKLTSGQIDYLIEGEASKSDVDSYFRYAVLNAYKKAMTERKLAPFAELKTIEEMKKLGHVPSRMSVTMPGIPGAPLVELEIKKTKD